MTHCKKCCLFIPKFDPRRVERDGEVYHRACLNGVAPKPTTPAVTNCHVRKPMVNLPATLYTDAHEKSLWRQKFDPAKLWVV